MIGMVAQAQSDRPSNFPAEIIGEKVGQDGHALIVDHLGKMFGRLNTWEGGFYLQFHPVDMGYSTLKENSCDYLEASGACGLHDDKPFMCRSVPFDPILPESQQAIPIEKFMKSFPCLTLSGDEGDLIYRDGQITSEPYRDGYSKKHQDLLENSSFMGLMAHSTMQNEGILPPAQYFIDASKRGAKVEVNIFYYLTAYVDQDQSLEADRLKDVLQFCDSQIELSGKLIAKAVVRKRKSELERTRAIRENMEMLKALKKTFLEMSAAA